MANTAGLLRDHSLASIRLSASSGTFSTPHPWRWLCHGLFWQRVGPAPHWHLPLELLQQLHWWFLVPLRRGLRGKCLTVSMPLGLRLRACWLNSYQPLVVGQLHHERWQQWPRQCRPAQELLIDKTALLALTPPAWRPAFLALLHCCRQLIRWYGIESRLNHNQCCWKATEVLSY